MVSLVPPPIIVDDGSDGIPSGLLRVSVCEWSEMLHTCGGILKEFLLPTARASDQVRGLRDHFPIHKRG